MKRFIVSTQTTHTYMAAHGYPEEAQMKDLLFLIGNPIGGENEKRNNKCFYRKPIFLNHKGKEVGWRAMRDCRGCTGDENVEE